MRVILNTNYNVGVQKPIILPKQALNLTKNLGNKDEFVSLNKLNAISFRGIPEPLPYYLKTYENDTIDAPRAIKIYEELKYAKYLDVPQNLWNGRREPSYKEIRQENLNFLNCLKDDGEKKKFLEYYCNLTGFPDLNKVSKKIENEFCRVALQGQRGLNQAHSSADNGPYSVLRMGYNDLCSVGKGAALPGSDIDGSYIIIKGGHSANEDKRFVDSYKSYLWNNTDSRILSYNHPAGFPQVYTINQVNALLKAADDETSKMHLREPSHLTNSPILRYLMGYKDESDDFIHYSALKNKYNDSFTEANSFFIKLCDKFNNNNTIDYNNPSKEMMKNFGFFIEVFTEGFHFGGIPETKALNELTRQISKSDFAHLTNLSQIHIKKQENYLSKKVHIRRLIESSYPKDSTEIQYGLVSAIIKASCGEDDGTLAYLAHGEDQYAPLLKALGQKN